MALKLRPARFANAAAAEKRVEELAIALRLAESRLEWVLRYGCARTLGSGANDFDYVPITIEMIDKQLALNPPGAEGEEGMRQASLFDGKSADFSPCRIYRYALWRHFGGINGYVNFIGLNPSTADETEDDPTIRRCIAYAKDWGYSGLCMTNLFAYRATDPKDMKKADDPIGVDNDDWLRDVASQASVVIAAWGKDGTYLNRSAKVRIMIPSLHYLRLSERTGEPWHPLYLPKDLRPIRWASPLPLLS